MRVEKIFIHPEFNNLKNLDNDIALLKLTKPSQMTDYVNTVRKIFHSTLKYKNTQGAPKCSKIKFEWLSYKMITKRDKKMISKFFDKFWHLLIFKLVDFQ